MVLYSIWRSHCWISLTQTERTKTCHMLTNDTTKQQECFGLMPFMLPNLSTPNPKHWTVLFSRFWLESSVEQLGKRPATTSAAKVSFGLALKPHLANVPRGIQRPRQHHHTACLLRSMQATRVKAGSACACRGASIADAGTPAGLLRLSLLLPARSPRQL